jgi:hypothetical protein
VPSIARLAQRPGVDLTQLGKLLRAQRSQIM